MTEHDISHNPNIDEVCPDLEARVLIPPKLQKKLGHTYYCESDEEACPFYKIGYCNWPDMQKEYGGEK